jgi:hypothetical protein
MPQQLACPNCQMTVSVSDATAGARTLCPGCQTEMTPVEEEEPIVGEEEEPEPPEPLGMRLVEVSAEASPPRPTVMMEASEPPRWKPTPVAQAWTTVATGLRIQRWGVFVALLQPAGMFVLLLLSRFGGVRLAAEDDVLPPAAWVGFGLTYLVIGVSGGLFVFGRLCCFRVPARTGAYLWIALAFAGTAVATLVALLTGWESFVPSSVDPLSRLRFAGRWTAFGLWMLSEWAFLWALNRVGHFVKHRGLVRLTGMTALGVTLLAGLVVATDLSGGGRFAPILEAVFAGVCVLYVFLLGTARSAVLVKTPEEKVEVPV